MYSESKSINLIWQVDPQFLIESDWILSQFPDFKANSIIDQHLEVVENCAIVITQGLPIEGKSVKAYLQEFRARGFKVGVIHISDEWFVSPIDFYDEADFVFRNFYRPDVSERETVFFLPVGYKQGYLNHIEPKSLDDRQYRWSFAGEVGGKISRRRMMKYAEQIPGGIAYLGKGYSDSSDLSFEGYAKLMSTTIFALAPGGNRCVETSRVYEALEAGAVPIVEDISKINLFKTIFREIVKPKEFVRHRVWTAKYWKGNWERLIAPSYWVQIYGPDFPCPRCSNWSVLRQLLQRIDTQKVKEDSQRFWNQYKASLQQRFSTAIERSFFSSEEAPARQR
ncbi:MAG: hypothetical protein WBA57_00160 [Elainellaceae cyanobacterium]